MRSESIQDIEIQGQAVSIVSGRTCQAFRGAGWRDLHGSGSWARRSRVTTEITETGPRAAAEPPAGLAEQLVSSSGRE